MNILISGGSGLLGTALCARLLTEGHQVTVLTRDPARTRQRCGPAVTLFTSLADWRPEQHFDAVINLAGAPIIDKAWSQARQREIWASRVTLTEELVAAMRRAKVPPAVLLSGSAVGVYGDGGELPCSDEQALPAADDFGARLCRAWEAAASQAPTRVCLLRTGLVLSAQGGMLARMWQPFQWGLGMRLGDGRQWMSWIHRDDWVAAACHLLQHPEASGAFNLTAPNPARNADFSQSLALALGRTVRMGTPACLLRLTLGQRAGLLLGGQLARPERLLQSGFAFCYPELDTALQQLVQQRRH